MKRYSRHLLMPEVGLSGQRRLASARILCVGAGGLAAPVLQYLAAAGVGCLGIVDDDKIDLTNLQRQVLFGSADVGRSKVEVAAERIAALNSDVSVLAFNARLEAGNARELARSYDVVVDTTDDFLTRYLVNDACRLEGKPYVYGAIFRFSGQVAVFSPPGPCYRCLFPQPPPPEQVPTCAEGGVLGALAGIVGAWQATEALKLVLGIGASLAGRLMLIDALGAGARELALERDASCALCGDAPGITDVCAAPLQAGAEPALAQLDASELDRFLTEFQAFVLDVREPHEVLPDLPSASVHIPASQLEARMHELSSAKTYVVACRVGRKSLWAASRLREAGFEKLYHLRDGLLAYALLGEVG